MDLGALRGRVLEANLMAFGVPVTITRPAHDSEPITTRGIWLTHEQETGPVGHDFGRVNPRRLMAIPTAAAPTLPRNSFIDAPGAPGNGSVLRWRVDAVDQTQSDHCRVALVQVT